MADSVFVRKWDEDILTLAASASVGELFQLPTGKAARFRGIQTSGGSIVAASSGDQGYFDSSGKHTLTKTAGFVALRGNRAYWDHSANAISYKKVNDRDFYAGRFSADAASADVNCEVDLNADPPYDLDLHNHPAHTILVGTPAALAASFNYPRRLGNTYLYYLSATSEAQKVDLVSVDGFHRDANAIVEFAFRVPVGGSGSASDYSLGIANATNATDADSIADSVFIHLDGGSVNIYAESDDGTTEVSATDTTIDFTAGLTVAERVEVWFDMRDPADVQIYVNGSLVLGSTVFNVNAYTGPWYLITHLEKTTGTETADLAVDWMRARYSEQ